MRTAAGWSCPMSIACAKTCRCRRGRGATEFARHGVARWRNERNKMKESVKTVLELVDGLKTYITCAVILVLLMLHWAGKLVLPPEFYAGLGVLALAFLRAGVGKAGPVAVMTCAGLLMVGCATPIADATLDRIEQVAS